MIIRGTTYTDTFPLKANFEDIEVLFVTYVQNGDTIIEKEKDEVTLSDDGTVILIDLDQNDTLQFHKPGAEGIPAQSLAYIQLRYKTYDGKAFASEIRKERIIDVLKEGLI